MRLEPYQSAVASALQDIYGFVDVAGASAGVFADLDEGRG
jgi:hypothetical protein